jgi:NTE family protein
MANIGLQWEVLSKIYLTPHVNMASVGFGTSKDYFKNALSPKGNWENADETSFVLAAGATLGYDSLLGPINLGASWTNEINKIRFFLSVGIPLYR